MKTPFPKTPDFSPVVKLMTLQTRFAIEASQGMMKLALLPWQIGVGISPSTTVQKAAETKVKPAAKPETKPTPAPAAKVATPKPQPAKAEAVAKPAVAMKAPAQPDTSAAPAPVVVKAVAAQSPKPAKPEVKTAPAKAAPAKPSAAPAAKLDDLTVLKGVGPKLAKALNDVGVTSYAQIAGWNETDISRIESQVAMAKGRVAKNGWVAQAADLAKVKA
jgi:predicted flap endonuclease-1-like 5' DNA nuclease